VSLGTERFLIDAGTGVGLQMARHGVRALDWPPVLLTHSHSDHTIDLGHLLITRWIAGASTPFEVWGPAGTKRQMELLLAYLDWDIRIRCHHSHDRQPPEVRVTEFQEGQILDVGGVRVSAFEVDHAPVKPAFGFRFEARDQKVVVSGDTRPCENLVRWSHGVDCLIHECCDLTHTTWAPGCGWPSKDAKVADLSSYHTNPDQVGHVAKDAAVKSLVLTHLMPGSDPADIAARVRRTYAGSVTVGEDLLTV
jgi:ribonuclease Z